MQHFYFSTELDNESYTGFTFFSACVENSEILVALNRLIHHKMENSQNASKVILITQMNYMV